MAEEVITLNEAAERSGVSASTLKRWAREGIIPVDGDRWTPTAAAQARVVARMRERGHALRSLRHAVREGRLAFGFVEDRQARYEEEGTITHAELDIGGGARIYLSTPRDYTSPRRLREESDLARRAFDNPIAIACSVDRAPCFPSRR